MSNRGITVNASLTLVVEECCHSGCGVAFALPLDLQNRRRNDHALFYCPNGHSQLYTGPSDEQKLRDAEARETALKDQLGAAVRDAERARVTLIRDRHRFANGVCPCCNRYFPNVHRHMETKHPDYDVTVVAHQTPTFECSCGRTFTTPHGLAVHQGRMRRPGWENKTRSWNTHLTVTA